MADHRPRIVTLSTTATSTTSTTLRFISTTDPLTYRRVSAPTAPTRPITAQLMAPTTAQLLRANLRVWRLTNSDWRRWTVSLRSRWRSRLALRICCSRLVRAWWRRTRNCARTPRLCSRTPSWRLSIFEWIWTSWTTRWTPLMDEETLEKLYVRFMPEFDRWEFHIEWKSYSLIILGSVFL